jgi:hypothetical protein
MGAPPEFQPPLASIAKRFDSATPRLWHAALSATIRYITSGEPAGPEALRNAQLDPAYLDTDAVG